MFSLVVYSRLNSEWTMVVDFVQRFFVHELGRTSLFHVMVKNWQRNYCLIPRNNICLEERFWFYRKFFNGLINVKYYMILR